MTTTFGILLAASLVLWAIVLLVPYYRSPAGFLVAIFVTLFLPVVHFGIPWWIPFVIVFLLFLLLRMRSNTGRVWVIACLAFVAVIATAVGILMHDQSSNTDSGKVISVTDSKSETPAATPSASPSPTAITCPEQFRQVEIGHSTDAKADEGFSQIMAQVASQPNGTVLNDEQKKLYLDRISSNAPLLAYHAHAFSLRADPNNISGLAANGCLTDEGKDLVSQIKGAMNSKGTTVTVGDADPNSVNTGIDGSTVVSAERPGITVPTKAMIITLPDGSKVTILFYCGNVTWPTAPPGVPTSPIVPQPPVPPATCPAGTVGVPPNCIEQKLVSLDPNSRDKAGNGGDLNGDPGPGESKAPAQMTQPPAAPYTAPAPAAASPAPVGTVAAPVPNPVETPRPSATPESAAPAPNEAPSTCVLPPGATVC